VNSRGERDWERDAHLLRSTTSYRVGVVALALQMVTVLVALPIVILGALNVISRSWFWLVIGAGTVGALVGVAAVIGLLVTAQRRRMFRTVPLGAVNLLAIMTQTMKDIGAWLRGRGFPHH
jgi:hypothetical protein